MAGIGSKTTGASLAEIERLYRQRAADFERVATAIVRDPDAARDVVQDAFVSLVRKRGRFARRGSLDAWAWRSVVNAALNRQRTVRRHFTQPIADRLPEHAGSEAEHELDGQILASLLTCRRSSGS